MKVRAFAAPALFLGVFVSSTSPTAVAPRRYKVEVKTLVVQDLTVVGQGEQKQEFSNSSFVSITLRDSAGGQVATIVLDSIVPGEGSPVTPDGAKTLAGTTWDGFIPAGGRLKDLKARGENPMAQVAESGVQQLFPPVKAGAKDGEAWTDTTETNTNGVGVRTVTNFQASNAMLDGTRVLQLAGTSSSSVSGEQTTPQGSMNIEGTVAGTANYLIGSDGALRRGTFRSVQTLSISVAQLPEPIPVTITLEGTSNLLP